MFILFYYLTMSRQNYFTVNSSVFSKAMDTEFIYTVLYEHILFFLI